MNISRRQQQLGIVAIVAVALLAGDRLVFTPLVQQWQARSERIAKLKESVAKSSLLLDPERETYIRSRWSHMRTNTLSAESSVAENQMLKAFDRWSQESRIGVTAIKPQWKRSTDTTTTLECRVDAFGSLPAITRFLYELEKDPLALKVEALEITTRDDAGEQLTLGLQVSGLVLAANATR